MDDHEMNWVLDSLTDNIEECERFALPIEAMRDAKELITDLRKEVERLRYELKVEKAKVEEYKKQPYAMWMRDHKETGFIKTDLSVSKELLEDMRATRSANEMLDMIAKDFMDNLWSQMNHVKV
jgi:phage-related minor tail protein